MEIEDGAIDIDIDKIMNGELKKKSRAGARKKELDIALSKAPGLKAYTTDVVEASQVHTVNFRKERAGKIYFVEVGCSFQLDEVTVKSIKIYRNSNHVETQKVIDAMGRDIFKNFIKDGIHKSLMGRSLIFASASLK